MPLSEAFAGTATIGQTPLSLPNNSTTLTPRTEDGIFQLFLDRSAVQDGDLFTLKIWEKVTGGGNQQCIATQPVGGYAGLLPYVTEPYILLHGWDMTLEKTGGTDRSFSWSIRRVG